MSAPTLEARIRRLEDIESLKTLKHRYAEYCDNDYNPDQLAPLFTRDAIWDGGPMGCVAGRDAIHAFFTAASTAMPFAVHHYTNAVIAVDGDRATGSWLLWQPCVHGSGAALWIAGRYQDEYQREDGEWKFAKVTFRPNVISPYELGFAKARMIEVPA